MFLFSNQKRDPSAFGLRMTESVLLMSFCSRAKNLFFSQIFKRGDSWLTALGRQKNVNL